MHDAGLLDGADRLASDSGQAEQQHRYRVVHGDLDDVAGHPGRADRYVEQVLEVAAGYADIAAGGGQPQSAPGAWGGHANGRIPAEALCPIDTAGRHRLRCDAATAFIQLDAAYQARFGIAITVTDAYRDYGDQAALKQSWCYRGRCEMAATPGRSNHGWGLALDLGGGINDFDTPQHAWMQLNAPAYGWHHPPWARESGGREEPWHWEYGGSSS